MLPKDFGTGFYLTSDYNQAKKWAVRTTARLRYILVCGMTDFGAGAIFEIWESERVTGDPRNSVYIRGE